jgi:hypothetical protein
LQNVPGKDGKVSARVCSVSDGRYHFTNIIVDWFVTGRNVSLVFSGELGSDHHDELLQIAEKERYGALYEV